MNILNEAIETLVQLRRQAYKAGDLTLGKFIEADLLRYNVSLEDTAEGTKWTVGQ